MEEKNKEQNNNVMLANCAPVNPGNYVVVDKEEEKEKAASEKTLAIVELIAIFICAAITILYPVVLIVVGIINRRDIVKYAEKHSTKQGVKSDGSYIFLIIIFFILPFIMPIMIIATSNTVLEDKPMVIEDISAKEVKEVVSDVASYDDVFASLNK